VGRACGMHKGELKCKQGFDRYVWKKTLIGRPRITFEDTIVDVDWGSRSRGYQPVEPRPIAAGPLCSSIQFRPSSPKALHVMRHALLVKDGITGEKWPVNLACDSDFHVNHRVFTCRKSATWDRRLCFTSEGRHSVEFFARDLGYQRQAC
jgi:hypothetical protein